MFSTSLQKMMYFLYFSDSIDRKSDIVKSNDWKVKVREGEVKETRLVHFWGRKGESKRHFR